MGRASAWICLFSSNSAGGNHCVSEMGDCSCRGCGPRIGWDEGAERQDAYICLRISNGSLNSGGRSWERTGAVVLVGREVMEDRG